MAGRPASLMKSGLHIRCLSRGSISLRCPVQPASAPLGLSYPVNRMPPESSSPTGMTEPKPFTDIPCPSNALMTLLEFMKFQWQGRRHEYYAKRFRQCGGPIYRETYGQFKVVNIIDAKAIETVFRCEGKHPLRIPLESWQLYRDLNGYSRGVFTDDGSNWKRRRRILDRHIMKPSTMATYAPTLWQVADDFVKRLRRLRDKENPDEAVANLTAELYKWSFESACSVLYERRFGILDDGPLDSDVAEFIYSMPKMFEGTERLFFIPYKWAKYLRPKYYKLFNEGFKGFIEKGEKFVDLKLTEIEKKKASGEEAGGFLSSLLRSQEMSLPEVYACMSELTGGAADTSSTTLQWMMYELSRHPDVQENLHDEMTNILGEKKVPTYDDFQKMPLLRGVVKETLRLHPVGFMVFRFLQQDAVLSGYLVPKGTLIQVPLNVSGRDPEVFQEPDNFKPERWIRNERQSEKSKQFLSLVFGFGIRGCVGKRIAELEMYSLLAKMALEFEILPTSDQEMDHVASFVLHPRDHVKVILKDRK